MWLVQKSIYRDGTDLVFAQKYGDKIAVAKNVNFVMVEQEAYAAIAEPTLILHGNGGQELMQAMWDAGFRPNDGAGSGAEAQSLKKHIEFAERMADGLLARFTNDGGVEHG